MPSLTFLPTGLRGIIACPVRAEPPLSHVDWIKDDKPLNLGMVSNFCFSHYSYKKLFNISYVHFISTLLLLSAFLSAFSLLLMLDILILIRWHHALLTLIPLSQWRNLTSFQRALFQKTLWITVNFFQQFPGWTLTSEGSIIIVTANDDAAGVYTCTPYNSFGTMGQSEPTTVILQVGFYRVLSF